MKAIILAAGRGRRICDVTNGDNKCLLSIGNSTILKRNVENVSALEEIKEIIIVVGYLASKVMMSIGNHCNGKPITYCYQKEQRGLMDALESAKYSLKGSDYLLLLGDEVIINNNYSKAIKEFKANRYNGFIGAIEVEDRNLVCKTYSLKLDEENNILDLVEKPQTPYNSIMGTGNILFKESTLEYLDKTPVNSLRGERDLVDFLKLIIEKERGVKIFKVGDHYINLNTKEDYELLLSLVDEKESNYGSYSKLSTQVL